MHIVYMHSIASPEVFNCSYILASDTWNVAKVLLFLLARQFDDIHEIVCKYHHHAELSQWLSNVIPYGNQPVL